MDQQPFHFIVKHGDKYYLTHELWEFDPAKREGLTDQQKASLDAMPKALAGGEPVQAAARIPHVAAAAFTAL
jgi:hypothetical protein